MSMSLTLYIVFVQQKYAESSPEQEGKNLLSYMRVLNELAREKFSYKSPSEGLAEYQTIFRMLEDAYQNKLS